ncbi:MAG: 4Fe-4S binding protein [Bacilli bacterium]|nr:4Fe-4S binding protein [Bacilli bacterium]
MTFDPVHHQAHIDKTKCINCGMCARACPYQAITNYKRPCKAVCPAGAISYNEDGISVIDEKKCTRCGSCACCLPVWCHPGQVFHPQCRRYPQGCEERRT